MRKGIIICPIDNRQVSKKTYCPDDTCDKCRRHPKPYKESGKNKKSTKKYSPIKYRQPESFYEFTEIDHLTIESLQWIEKKIDRLKREPGDNDQDIKYYELLYELGLKKFNLSYYFFRVDELNYFSPGRLNQLAENLRQQRKNRKKRENDYKKIIKIFDKHKRIMLAVDENIISFDPLYSAIRSALEDYLCKPTGGETKLEYYLLTKGVEPEKNNPDRWILFDELIVFIVDDLRRIGYSENSAFKIAAKLLSKRFSTIFKNVDNNAIRERYKYFQEKKRKIEKRISTLNNPTPSVRKSNYKLSSPSIDRPYTEVDLSKFENI